MLLVGILLSGGSALFPRIPLLVFMLGLYAVISPRLRGYDSRLLPASVLLGLLFLNSIFGPSGLDITSLAIRYANFIAGLLLLNVYLNYPREQLGADMYPMLKWMSLQVIATYIVGTVASFLFMHLTVDGTEFRTILGVLNYHNMANDEATAAIRPDGFFFEPGVLQFYLNIYLYLALFIHRSWRQASLAVVALVTTASTTGIIICVLVLVAFFIQYLRAQSLRRKLLALVVGVVLAVPIGLIAQANIMDKFTGDMRGSSWAREYDLFTGLNVFQAHWLRGVGFDRRQYLDAAKDLGYEDTPLRGQTHILYDRDNSNGIVYILYSIGLPFALILFLGMFRQRFFPNRLLAGAILFLSLFGESITFTPFPLLLIFSGLTGRWKFSRPRAAAHQLDEIHDGSAMPPGRSG
jgi:hypothetical protein